MKNIEPKYRIYTRISLKRSKAGLKAHWRSWTGLRSVLPAFCEGTETIDDPSTVQRFHVEGEIELLIGFNVAQYSRLKEELRQVGDLERAPIVLDKVQRWLLDEGYVDLDDIVEDDTTELNYQRVRMALEHVMKDLVVWFHEFNVVVEGRVDQENIIDKFESECNKKKLIKGQTIPRNILYEVARAINLKGLGSLESFKTGHVAYQIMRQYASIKGFKQKKLRNR